jgi:hypothetical protein
MATAREIAIEVLPHFSKNVLAGIVLPYGVYAHHIGRDPAKESMVIGQAMHAIGAVCVLTQRPVAPLHFVERADGAWRGVFESNPEEGIYVLPHYELLLVTARIYKYTQKDFDVIGRALREWVPKHLPPELQSPHDIWRLAIYTKRKDKDNKTPLDLALARYRELMNG